MLLEHQATLLPIICANFNQYVRELAEQQEVEELPEVNSRRILCEIKARYQHHVACVCKVRKYVFRPTSTWRAMALWTVTMKSLLNLCLLLPVMTAMMNLS